MSINDLGARSKKMKVESSLPPNATDWDAYVMQKWGERHADYDNNEGSCGARTS